MNIRLTAFYLCLFASPIAYQRIKFRFWPETFEELSPLRRMTGLDLHHGHWGLFWMVFAGMWNSLYQHNILTASLFFFGLGLVSDEIIPFLRMPGQGRTLELATYARSLRPTLILGSIMLLVILALCFLKQ